MAVVTRSPRLRTDSVMRVQEYDEACFCECSPERFKRRVIQARSNAPRSHDDATDMGVASCELRDLFRQGVGGSTRDEREEAHAVESLEFRSGRNRGTTRAVILKVCIQLPGERLSLREW